MLIFVVQRVSEVSDPELGGQPVRVRSIGCDNHLATLLSNEVVYRISFSLVNRLLWSDNQEHGAMRILPVVDQHWRGHRVGDEITVIRILPIIVGISERVPHVGELVQFLIFVCRIGGGLAHHEQHRK